MFDTQAGLLMNSQNEGAFKHIVNLLHGRDKKFDSSLATGRWVNVCVQNEPMSDTLVLKTYVEGFFTPTALTYEEVLSADPNLRRNQEWSINGFVRLNSELNDD